MAVPVKGGNREGGISTGVRVAFATVRPFGGISSLIQSSSLFKTPQDGVYDLVKIKIQTKLI
jgi:hypothetical protein